MKHQKNKQGSFMCETVSGLSHFMLDHLHGLSTDLHDVAINHLHLFGA